MQTNENLPPTTQTDLAVPQHDAILRAVHAVARLEPTGVVQLQHVLSMAETEKQNKLIFHNAMNSLFDRRENGQIGPLGFNTQMNRIVELDDSTDSHGIEHRYIREVIITNVCSEDQKRSKKWMRLTESMSTEVMKRLGMVDGRWCATERMAQYIRDEMFQAGRTRNIDEAYSVVIELLAVSIERDDDEMNFCLEVIDQMNQEVVDSLKTLAREGNSDVQNFFETAGVDWEDLGNL